MENPAPKIVNVPPLPQEFDFSGRPRLRGLHITDPETIGKGLRAFGIEDQEIPEWTIYTGIPDQALGEGELALDIPNICQTVEALARKKKLATAEMFKHVIGAVLFTELYKISPQRDALIEKTVLESRTYKVEAALLASLATVSAPETYGFGAAVPVGLVSAGALARYETWALWYKVNRASGRLLNQIKTNNLGLEKQLSDVTLPVYFGG